MRKAGSQPVVPMASPRPSPVSPCTVFGIKLIVEQIHTNTRIYSKILTSIPVDRRAIAVASPPIPAPMIAIMSGAFLFRSQRPEAFTVAWNACIPWLDIRGCYRGSPTFKRPVTPCLSIHFWIVPSLFSVSTKSLRYCAASVFAGSHPTAC
jgi:hypothetical protein